MDEFGEKIEVKENVKRKSRNLSEKKRRDQFNILISELHSMVSPVGRKMDKTAILKATIAFLLNHKENKRRSNVFEIKEDWKPSFLSNDEFAQLMLEALDGFIMVLAQDGTILHVSDGITPLLKYLPMDLINHHIYEFLHPDDWLEVQTVINKETDLGPGSVPDYDRLKNQLSFTCHIESGVSSPDGGKVYQKVRIKGSFHTCAKPTVSAESFFEGPLSPKEPEIPENIVCFGCSVQILSHQILRELSIVDETKKQFASKHNMEWKFLSLDHRGSPIIGYLPLEVLGTSGYDYYHPDDLSKVAKCHTQLIKTGEGRSCYYRFMTKGQESLWIQSHYYITYHQWTSKPEFVVCTHTVVSYADVLAKRDEEESDILRNGGDLDTALQCQSMETEIATSSGQREPPYIPDMSPQCTSTDTKDESLVDSSLAEQPSSSQISTGGRLTPQIAAPISPSMAVSPAVPNDIPSLMEVGSVERTETPDTAYTPQPSNEAPATPASSSCTIDIQSPGPSMVREATTTTQKSALPHGAELPNPQPCTQIVNAEMSPALNDVATLATQQIHNQKQLLNLLHMSPIQQQLRVHLEQKHKQLKDMIVKEQKELSKIWDQLIFMSQFTGQTGTGSSVCSESVCSSTTVHTLEEKSAISPNTQSTTPSFFKVGVLQNQSVNQQPAPQLVQTAIPQQPQQQLVQTIPHKPQQLLQTIPTQLTQQIQQQVQQQVLQQHIIQVPQQVPQQMSQQVLSQQISQQFTQVPQVLQQVPQHVLEQLSQQISRPLTQSVGQAGGSSTNVQQQFVHTQHIPTSVQIHSSNFGWTNQPITLATVAGGSLSQVTSLPFMSVPLITQAPTDMDTTQTNDSSNNEPGTM